MNYPVGLEHDLTLAEFYFRNEGWSGGIKCSVDSYVKSIGEKKRYRFFAENMRHALINCRKVVTIAHWRLAQLFLFKCFLILCLCHVMPFLLNFLSNDCRFIQTAYIIYNMFAIFYVSLKTFACLRNGWKLEKMFEMGMNEAANWRDSEFNYSNMNNSFCKVWNSLINKRWLASLFFYAFANINTQLSKIVT